MFIMPSFSIGLRIVATMGEGGLSHGTCGLLYGYQAYSFQTFMTSLEIVLAFRGDPDLFFPLYTVTDQQLPYTVYATFNQSKFIAVLLFIIIAFDTIFCITIPLTTNPYAKFTANCVVSNHPAGLRWLT
jgi:hypothetical protein